MTRKQEKKAARDSSYEESLKEEEEIADFVREITNQMVEIVCQMLGDDISSQCLSSNHIMSERKQVSKEFYPLGNDTSASSKLDSHLTATTHSEADVASLGQGTRKKKKGGERKQSFGTKKKFKEEIEVHPSIDNLNVESHTQSDAVSPSTDFNVVAGLRKHESVP